MAKNSFVQVIDMFSELTSKIISSFQNKNWVECERFAHTLKGRIRFFTSLNEYIPYPDGV